VRQETISGVVHIAMTSGKQGGGASFKETLTTIEEDKPAAAMARLTTPYYRLSYAERN